MAGDHRRSDRRCDIRPRWRRHSFVGYKAGDDMRARR